MSAIPSTQLAVPTPHHFVVAGEASIDLDAAADALRAQISVQKLPLAKQKLSAQAGVLEVLLVVRQHEDPHTHPNADLVFTLLEGGGWLQRSVPPDPATSVPVEVGTTVVVPKGTCHAFHNTSPTDSVLLASFSPGDPTPHAGCPPKA